MMDGHVPIVPIWVCSTPVDMRKGFDSLSEYVRAFLGRDPMKDGMFVFRGRSGHLLKILWYDRTGAVLYYKRLHKGSFRLPACDGPGMPGMPGMPGVTLEPRQLLELLEGLEPAARRAAD
jgi:transposase